MIFSFTHLGMFLLAFVVGACGANVLEGTEDQDPATSATRALEQKKPTQAIQTLEKALAKDPENSQLWSILATAYAQRAGIEPLSVAEAVATREHGSSLGMMLGDDNSSLISLFNVMPSPTTDRLSDIDQAVHILAKELPQDSWLPGDSFKFAIYQTASTVMHLKALDTNEDGQLSLQELLGLSGGDSLVDQLASASSILGAQTNAGAAAKAAEVLNSHRSDIESMEGATMDEKLRQYLAKVSGTSSTLTATGSK